MAGELSSGRLRFPVVIECPHCKHAGSVIWEESAEPSPDGLRPELVEMPEGFSQLARSGVAGVLQIVCEHCDFVLPD